MKFWYAYTGESLIAGRGRTIRSVINDTKSLEYIIDLAEKRYAEDLHFFRDVPKDAFISALIAPLAVEELGAEELPATQFSEAGQVLALFDNINIEQAATNLFNGRVASTYAQGDIEAVIAHVARGFDGGDLLFLPRNTAQIYTQEVLNTLPGVLVFLLTRAQAEHKAFSGYLRRGTPPVISDADSIIMANNRPILRTWEREARLETQYTSAGV